MQVVPRVCVVGGKAAPGYEMAKRIIKLISAVGNKINSDPDIGDLLKLVFVPDYNVSLAEVIIPGAHTCITPFLTACARQGTIPSGSRNAVQVRTTHVHHPLPHLVMHMKMSCLAWQGSKCCLAAFVRQKCFVPRSA
jgi:hypothetical protein